MKKILILVLILFCGCATSTYGFRYRSDLPMKVEYLIGKQIWPMPRRVTDINYEETGIKTLEELRIVDAEIFQRKKYTDSWENRVKLIFDNGGECTFDIYIDEKGIPHINLNYNFFVENPYEKYPDWLEEMWDKIRRNELWLGMTKEQVIVTMYDTDKKNRSIGPWGVKEQWIYFVTPNKNIYLYFENDELTSWQD